MSLLQQGLPRLPRNASSSALVNSPEDGSGASRPFHDDGSEARIKTYYPLPLDLFPRPDPKKEIEESGRASCFRYYDLGKYTVEEATRLASMDIIPKNALGISSNKQDIRALRSTRGKTSRYERPLKKNAKNTFSSGKISSEQEMTGKKRKSGSEEAAPAPDGVRKRGRPRKIAVSCGNVLNNYGSKAPLPVACFQMSSADKVSCTVKSIPPKKLGSRLTFIKNLQYKFENPFKDQPAVIGSGITGAN